MSTKTLQRIKKFALEKYSRNRDMQHDAGHIDRVRKNALLIADSLGDRYVVDRNLLEAACYLHDVVICTNKGTIFSMIFCDTFEKLLNKKYLPDIVSPFHLSENETTMLITAVVNHPHSIPYRMLNRHNDIYSKILQDADSLDYISEEREDMFRKTKGRILPWAVHWYVSTIRKNIRYYLNFPELSVTHPGGV